MIGSIVPTILIVVADFFKIFLRTACITIDMQFNFSPIWPIYIFDKDNLHYILNFDPCKMKDFFLRSSKEHLKIRENAKLVAKYPKIGKL